MSFVTKGQEDQSKAWDMGQSSLFNGQIEVNSLRQDPVTKISNELLLQLLHKGFRGRLTPEGRNQVPPFKKS
ncbi:unnamed protein product [Caretta caretta]